MIQSMRRRLLPLVLALLLLIVVSVSALSSWDRVAGSPTVQPVQTASMAAANGSPFGVEEYAWGWRDVDTVTAQLSDLGVGWTRVNQLKWRDVEPVQGAKYDWTAYDQLLEKITSKGLAPIVVIADSPDWALVDPNFQSGPIKDDCLDDFTSFVAAAVSRYSVAPFNIKYWELFNEPDSTVGTYGPVIGSWGNYGAAYADMLKAVYPAVKAVDPDSRVVFGGLAYSSFLPAGPFNRAFLDDVLKAGGCQYFDVMNFHYYAVQAPEWATYGTDIAGKANYLRERLSSHGCLGKSIIATEVGSFGRDESSFPGEQEQQAQYVAKVYSRGVAAGLGLLMWYSLNEGTDGTGLIGSGVLKPAYQAYKTMTLTLAEASFARKLPATLPLQPDASSFEGYAFHDNSAANREIWVVWVNTGTATLRVRAEGVDAIDKFGQPVALVPGPAGYVDVPLSTSPIYLRLPQYSVYVPNVLLADYLGLTSIVHRG